MTMCFLYIILPNALQVLSCYKNVFILQNDILVSLHPGFRGIFFFWDLNICCPSELHIHRRKVPDIHVVTAG